MHSKQQSPIGGGPSVSPAATSNSVTVNVDKPKPSNKIFPTFVARPAVSTDHGLVTPGPDTPPEPKPTVFPPAPPPFQLDHPVPTAISQFLPQSTVRIPVSFPKLIVQVVPGASEMEDVTQPSSARPIQTFLLNTMPANVSGGHVGPFPREQTSDFKAVNFGSKAADAHAIAPTSILEMYLLTFLCSTLSL